VFIAGGTSKGFAYAVWRTDHQFGNRQQIIQGLRGCCTLLDIQVKDNELWVAENARHRLIRYDRDGKELASFGKRDRTAGDGFGGCCEPKNLRFGPEGDIYCSQSESPTVVKRFTPQGEFRGVVTLADFKCGCARVTVEISKDCRTVYVLDPATDTIRKFVAKGAGAAGK
jgi:sugar lactone lactonase YvrE